MVKKSILNKLKKFKLLLKEEGIPVARLFLLAGPSYRRQRESAFPSVLLCWPVAFVDYTDDWAVYGSYARGTAREDRDIDVCVVSSIFGKDRVEENLMFVRF